MAAQSLGQSLGRVVAGHLADDKRVVTDNFITRSRDIRLRRTGLLIGKSEADQEPIKRLSTAIKDTDRVITLELFNSQPLGHL